MNPFFLNQRMLYAIRAHRPQVLLYLPWTSGTPRTFLRAAVLRVGTGVPLALFLSQPYRSARWIAALTRPLMPDLILAMEDSVVNQFREQGAAAAFVSGGVDLNRFGLAGAAQRAKQREELGIPVDTRMILHVGHLNRRRLNPAELAVWTRGPGRRLVIVGSPDTPQDSSLTQELEQAGCRVIGDYLPRIEELYGAADLYWFPTMDDRSSIGVPLSVLEALACGIPVVASRFGGLPRLFPSTPFVRFVTSPNDLERALQEAPAAPDPGARKLVERLDWSQIGKRVATLLGEISGS
jgi:glycosyltransferase involved in cell wall biosynthesis